LPQALHRGSGGNPTDALLLAGGSEGGVQLGWVRRGKQEKSFNAFLSRNFKKKDLTKSTPPLLLLEANRDAFLMFSGQTDAASWLQAVWKKEIPMQNEAGGSIPFPAAAQSRSRLSSLFSGTGKMSLDSETGCCCFLFSNAVVSLTLMILHC